MSMLKAELRSLLKHKFMIAVLFAIALIPALYNIIFLSSMWDPYGNVTNLPVAVVNNDQSKKYNGTTLKIGDQLVTNMKKTKSLDYHYVSKSKAAKGLKNGDYYLVITIPKNFSSNAATLVTDSPKNMKIDYQTSKGHNFTASKMADSAVVTLKDKVSTQVTKLYTKTILAQFGTTGKSLATAGSGSKKLADGTKQLADGSQTIQTNLNKLASSSLTFADGANTLNVGLKTYVAGVDSANSGANQLSTGVGTLAASVPALSTGINKLDSGASSLATGVNQYTTGVGSLATGASTLNAGISKYTDGVSSANTGAAQLSAGLNQLAEQTAVLPSKTKELADGATQLADGLANSSTSSAALQ